MTIYKGCRFCSINHQKTMIVKRGKYCFVVLSNPRLMPGHLLVVPTRHVEKVSELLPKESTEIFNMIQEFSEKILKIASAYSIHQNYMPILKESKTKVNHLHIHIYPREFNDEIYIKSWKFQHQLFNDLSEAEMLKYKKLLR